MLKEIVFPTAALLISFTSLIISLLSLRRSLTRQTLSELLNEYRSERMGDAIIALWQFFKKDCHSIKTELITNYSNRVKADIDCNNSSHLHNQRRLVSQFYQIVATYYYYRIIPRKRIRDLWSRSDLDIIDKILYPIEKDAMPLVLGVEPKGKVSKPVKYMYRLYQEMKG